MATRHTDRWLTIAGPALSLMSMFIGMIGGMLVAMFSVDMPVVAYWQRIVEFATFGDFVHGMSKSLLFSWIIAIERPSGERFE